MSNQPTTDIAQQSTSSNTWFTTGFNVLQATCSSQLDFTPAIYNDSLLSTESLLRAHNKTLDDYPDISTPDCSAAADLPACLMQAELAYEGPALAHQVKALSVAPRSASRVGF